MLTSTEWVAETEQRDGHERGERGGPDGDQQQRQRPAGRPRRSCPVAACGARPARRDEPADEAAHAQHGRRGSRPPAAPVPSTSTAMTTMKTADAPATTACAHTSAVDHGQVPVGEDRAEAGQGLATKRFLGSASSGAGLRSGCVVRRSSAERGHPDPRARAGTSTRRSAALKRKTTSTSGNAMSRAPSAGPTKTARFSRVLEVALEAVSSSGGAASGGISAAERSGTRTPTRRAGERQHVDRGEVEGHANGGRHHQRARTGSAAIMNALRGTGRRARRLSARRRSAA